MLPKEHMIEKLEKDAEEAGRAMSDLLDCPFCGERISGTLLQLNHAPDCYLGEVLNKSGHTEPEWTAMWNKRAPFPLCYTQAKKAIELFDGEWIGQDPKKLWDWATKEACGAI